MNQGIRRINFPDHEYFSDEDDNVDMTPVIDKIAPFKKIRIKNYSQHWFDFDILNQIILNEKRLNKFKASRLNINEQLYKEAKIKSENWKCWWPQGATESP